MNFSTVLQKKWQFDARLWHINKEQLSFGKRELFVIVIIFYQIEGLDSSSLVSTSSVIPAKYSDAAT